MAAANVLLYNGNQLTLQQNNSSVQGTSSNNQTLIYNPGQTLMYANGGPMNKNSNNVFTDFQIVNLGQNGTSEYIISSPQLIKNDANIQVE